MCEEHSPQSQMYDMFVIAIRYHLNGFSCGFALYRISLSTISHKTQGCLAIALAAKLPVENLGMVIKNELFMLSNFSVKLRK